MINSVSRAACCCCERCANLRSPSPPCTSSPSSWYEARLQRSSDSTRPVELTQELADPLARLEDLLYAPQIGPGIGAVHRAAVDTMSDYAHRANPNPFARVTPDRPPPPPPS